MDTKEKEEGGGGRKESYWLSTMPPSALFVQAQMVYHVSNA